MLNRYSKTIDTYVEVFKQTPWLEHAKHHYEQLKPHLKPETLTSRDTWMGYVEMLMRTVSGYNSVQVMGAVLIALFLTSCLFMITDTNPIMNFRVQLLQEKSWDNGLQTIATLEDINSTMDQMDTIALQNAVGSPEIQRKRKALQASLTELKGLLKERNVLVQDAQRLNVKTLYFPVYQNLLTETQARIAKTLYSPRLRTSNDPATSNESAQG